MYNPDGRDKPFKPEAVSNQTESIYKSKKFILSLVSHSLDRLKPAMRKYYQDMQEFCDGYESGMIRDWRRYFRIPKR